MVDLYNNTMVARQALQTPIANGAQFGGGIGRSLQGAGQAVQSLGGKIIDEKEKDDVNAVMELETALDEFNIDTDKDLYSRRGKQALGVGEEYKKRSKEWYDKISAQLTNARQKQLFENMYNRKSLARLESLSRFETQEKQHYYDETTASRTKTAIDDALSNYSDDKVVNQAFNSGLAAIKVNYAGRDELMADKIKDYQDKFYNAQIMKRAETDINAAEAYYHKNKGKLSGTAQMSAYDTLQKRKTEQENHAHKEVKKEAMLCVAGDSESCRNLLNKAQSGKLTPAEIEAAMPAGAGTSFKNLIYRRQGYLTGPAKLDENQQQELKQKIYESIGAVTSNQEAKIEDFKAMEDLIYEGIDKKAVSESEGTRLLNDISAPLMNKWKEKAEAYSDNAWFEPNLGVKNLDNWLEDSYLMKSKIINKESKEQQKVLNAANARIKTQAYQLYFENLQDIVKETEGLHSVADILNLKSKQQRAIYEEAQERVKQDFAAERYQSLRNITVNPTYVLSQKDGLVQISGKPEAKPSGKPLTENRVLRVAFDKASDKYGLVMADGTVKEVSREIYKSYGGKN